MGFSVWFVSSGGGGYILGFTQDLDKAKIALKDYKLEVVYNF